MCRWWGADEQYDYYHYYSKQKRTREWLCSRLFLSRVAVVNLILLFSVQVTLFHSNCINCIKVVHQSLPVFFQHFTLSQTPDVEDVPRVDSLPSTVCFHAVLLLFRLDCSRIFNSTLRHQAFPDARWLFWLYVILARLKCKHVAAWKESAESNWGTAINATGCSDWRGHGTRHLCHSCSPFVQGDAQTMTCSLCFLSILSIVLTFTRLPLRVTPTEGMRRLFPSHTSPVRLFISKIAAR